MFRRLVFGAVLLAFIVVIVGAYVRLQDAGLGCPDWPGCYGHWVGVPGEAHEVERAEQAFPDRPIEARKAWKELFHRYLAGTLGVLLLAILTISWLQRRALRQSPWLPTAIVALAALQGALGMWTVTLLLKPMIVTLHLLGGMATLGLLTWLALRQLAPPYGGARTNRLPQGGARTNRLAHGGARLLPPDAARAKRLRPWAVFGLVIVACQIALGGWVAANYAALACQDFPTCHGVWLPDMDFRHGFQFVRELGMTAAGAPLAFEALTAIHWMHRVGALLTFLYIGAFAAALISTPGLSRHGALLLLLLLIQVCLGVANVVSGLPLPVAVAHNGAAAAMLVMLTVINFALFRNRSPA
jgi:cytochrome c oxidase assembly protein subunit 15